ncbi:MAG TPA: PKD domain-containing protein, partial [Cytophagaceae bacterium]|nr:PKD domain-containing protein [Cytophagaceae bacterium]
SVNGKYLYVSQGVSAGPLNVNQFNITSGVAATIAGTINSLGTTIAGTGKSGHLQLGPDGNIYVAQMSSYGASNYNQYIGVIQKADSANAAFNNKYITINDGTLNQQQVTMGLPTILKSLLVQGPPDIVNDTLSKTGDTITVCPSKKFYLTYKFTGNTVSVLWKFGDGTTSTALVPSHSYATPGVYTVTLIITDPCSRKDSVVNYVKVPAYTTAGTLSCSGGNKIVMTGTGPGKANYIWYTAATGGTVLGTGASVTSGVYSPASSAPNSVWVEDATGFNTYSALSTHKPSQQILAPTGSILTNFTTYKSLTLVSVQAVQWSNSCTAGNVDSVLFTFQLAGSTVATTKYYPVVCGTGVTTFTLNMGLPIPGNYTISYTMKSTVPFTNGFQVDYYSTTTSTSLTGVASIGVGGNANLYSSGPDTGPFYNFVFMDNSACATRLQVTRACSLPVDFIYFKATPDGTSNLIEWATANEWNNDHFVLERSDDGINFTPITKISGAGNSSQIQYYNYIDSYAQRGVVYYRLAQVDINGGTHYSIIVSLNRNGDDLVKVAPNPFTDQTNLVFLTNVAASVRVVDLVGRIVATYEKTAQDGILSIGTGLSKGTYIVQVVTDTQEHNYKIIKE